jgi:hypothetical protein
MPATLTPTSRITKSVDYAYPSSTTAGKYGFGRTGCYAVYERKGNQPPRSLAAFSTLDEARQYAETLTHPWDRYTR